MIITRQNNTNGSYLVKAIPMIKEKIKRFKILKEMGDEERLKDSGKGRSLSNTMTDEKVKTVILL